MWKIGAGAVPLPRLAWPSRCSRCWAVGRGLLDAPRMRAGQCPAPTIKKDGFRIHVGAAHRAARLPWIGGRPKGLPYPTLEEFLENRRGGRLPLSRGDVERSETEGIGNFPSRRSLKGPVVHRRGGTPGRPPVPTAQLDPRRSKDTFNKGGAILPVISLPNLTAAPSAGETQWRSARCQ